MMTTNLLDLSEYEHMTPTECWKRHGWGSEAISGTPVLHRSVDGYELFLDVVDDSYGGKHACELFEPDGLVGQWFADTPQDAIRGAVIESIGYNIMRSEGNCEDAVNVIAGTAFERLFGVTFSLSADAIGQLDELLRMAREYVKSHVKWVNYEWEEF